MLIVAQLLELLAECGAVDGQQARGEGLIAVGEAYDLAQHRLLKLGENCIVSCLAVRLGCCEFLAHECRDDALEPAGPCRNCGAETCSGRCSMPMIRPLAATPACSMALRSSRTLPGHGYRRNASSASGLMAVGSEACTWSRK